MAKPEVSIETGVRLITPQDAEKLLQKNTMNRAIVNNVVQRYTEEMEGGRWVFNGEPIILNGDGTLLDGQHRLAAVVASGVPLLALVVQGVRKDAFSTIDSGRTRSASDVLGVDGFHNTRTLAAAARLAWAWKNRTSTDGFNPHRYVSNVELMEFVKSNPALEFSTSRMLGTTVSRLMPGSMATWLHYEFSRREPKKAEQFFTQLDSGENIAKGNPVFHLRERLIANRTGSAKFNRETIAGFSIKAWNAFQADHPLRLLRLAPDEQFPEIQPELEYDGGVSHG